MSDITEAQINTAGVLAYACTIPGTIVCGLVLIAYGLAALSPMARKCFDRVSFRLLVCSLVFNVLFGIAYAATPTHPGTGCEVGAFAVNLTLCFATFFTTCIAINLQLVLVHGIDGQKLEKYYLFGTTILSLGLNVPTVALRQFGWNDLSATCWYSNADEKLRLRWVIGTQSFWISLAATIETICSLVVIFWMYNWQRGIIRRFKPLQSLGSAKGMSDTEKSDFAESLGKSLLSRDPRYRVIILRIAFYPIVSLMMNYSTVALDLYTSIVGVNSQLDFRLLVLDLILYGLRTLAYGLLAAGDPSFINAIREIRGPKGTKKWTSIFPSMAFASGDARTITQTTDTKFTNPDTDHENMNTLEGGRNNEATSGSEAAHATQAEDTRIQDEIQRIVRRL